MYQWIASSVAPFSHSDQRYLPHSSRSESVFSHPVAETQKFVEDAIAAAPGLRLEYFEIVDGTTLQKITDWEDTDYAVGCITVFCGEVRLIDNIKYKG